MKTVLKYMVFFIFVSLLVWGCLNPFSPGLVDRLDNSSAVITEQKNPDDVLTNFKYAYTFKDSLVFSDLIDSSYIFRTWDYNNSPPTPVEWNRDEELRVTGRMFRYFNHIELVWNKTVYRDTLSEKLIEMRKSFTLVFNDGSEIPVLNGDVLFRFRKTKSEKWTIAYWEDLKI